ncbi:hypothetical protein BHM03_00038753 [Ensete ventricosum]|nr:hypothetical protein BHM03_00038753 [Ensete ventricosum]
MGVAAPRAAAPMGVVPASTTLAGANHARGRLPMQAALAMCGHPCGALNCTRRPYKGPGCGQLPLQVAWPWEIVSLYFQIQMERMKEVKRPPLERYPHDRSPQ